MIALPHLLSLFAPCVCEMGVRRTSLSTGLRSLHTLLDGPAVFASPCSSRHPHIPTAHSSVAHTGVYAWPLSPFDRAPIIIIPPPMHRCSCSSRTYTRATKLVLISDVPYHTRTQPRLPTAAIMPTTTTTSVVRCLVLLAAAHGATAQSLPTITAQGSDLNVNTPGGDLKASYSNATRPSCIDRFTPWPSSSCPPRSLLHHWFAPALFTLRNNSMTRSMSCPHHISIVSLCVCSTYWHSNIHIVSSSS